MGTNSKLFIYASSHAWRFRVFNSASGLRLIPLAQRFPKKIDTVIFCDDIVSVSARGDDACSRDNSGAHGIRAKLPRQVDLHCRVDGCRLWILGDHV